MSFYSDVMSSDMYESALWKELTDKNGNEISVALSMIGEIPVSRMLKTQFSIDETAELIIKLPEDLVRTYYIEDVNEHDNYYYIDYKRDYIYFSKNLVHQTFLIRYYGTRFEAISANKIFTNIDNTGQPTEFLDNILNSVHDVVEVCNKINNLPDLIDTLETEEENLSNQITTIEEDINTAIKTNSQLNITKNNAISINQTLTDNITKGEEVNVSLLNNTSAGTNLSSTLETQITTGNNLSTELATKTEQANNSKTNLDSVIPEGKELISNISKTDNYNVEIEANQLVKNDVTGDYEYTLNHNQNSLKCKFQFFDEEGYEIFNMGHVIDKDNYKVVNDEQIKIKVTINKGYWGGTI